jgi:HEAT repeat protein
MKRKIVYGVSILILVIIAPIVYRFFLYPLSLYLFPKRAIHIFYTRECAEDQNMYPLIIAGKRVIPYLIEEIKNPEMYKRRYAIGALGLIGDTKVIPFLEKLLDDESEICYFRYDALVSIATIDFEYAKKLANKYVDKKIEMVSELSKELLTDAQRVKKRFYKPTLWDAIFDRHD